MHLYIVEVFHDTLHLFIEVLKEGKTSFKIMGQMFKPKDSRLINDYYLTTNS